MSRPACMDHDPEKWFPKNRAGEVVAQAYCRTCPLRVECLIAALRMEGTRAASGRAGIWGGATEKERAAMVRRAGKVETAIEMVRQRSALADGDEGASECSA